MTVDEYGTQEMGAPTQQWGKNISSYRMPIAHESVAQKGKRREKRKRKSNVK